METTHADGLSFTDASPYHSYGYLLPVVSGLLRGFFAGSDKNRRVFDLGCGNGSIASRLAGEGYEVVGVDPSESGIAQARQAFPHIQLELGSGYDDLASRFGTFPAVITLEVIEHVYAPRDFVRTLYDLVEDDGIAVVSTPYHGYIKNVAVALSGNFDHHVNPLWDHGHIKFWSRKTLGTVLQEAGFRSIRFTHAGRFFPIPKSLVAIARK